MAGPSPECMIHLQEMSGIEKAMETENRQWLLGAGPFQVIANWVWGSFGGRRKCSVISGDGCTGNH